MLLSNKVYDVLRWITQYLIPAIGTLYFTLSQIWGLPYGEEILGSLVALDIALSAILGISKHEYNKTLQNPEDKQ